jgi:hypothetical protein
MLALVAAAVAVGLFLLATLLLGPGLIVALF